MSNTVAMPILTINGIAVNKEFREVALEGLIKALVKIVLDTVCRYSIIFA
jgi:hypothetical protein